MGKCCHGDALRRGGRCGDLGVSMGRCVAVDRGVGLGGGLRSYRCRFAKGWGSFTNLVCILATRIYLGMAKLLVREVRRRAAIILSFAWDNELESKRRKVEENR
jgi:hypothetical protein